MELSIKLDLKIWVFELCIASPALFTLLYCFSSGIARRFVIIIMVLSFFLLIKTYAEKGKRFQFFTFLGFSIFYMVYIASIEGASALIHSNFYSFFLMFIMFCLFSDEDMRYEFRDYFLLGKKRFLIYVLLCFLGVGYSIIFMNGLQVGYGSSIPVLYGPFEIAHMLAYIMLVIYCGLSAYDKENDSKLLIALRVLVSICIIWSAVRSAVLALLILILVDYFSINRIGRKTGVLVVGVILLAFIALNTDLLTNNPLIEKTLYATDTGGSITNGREWYREAALNFYKNSTNLFEQLFGSGVEAVIQSIHNALGVSIHAHNDYVNVLVGYGLVGLLLMIICQLRSSKACSGIFNKIALQAFIFILAYYNGFALYIMLMAGFPVITCFFDCKSRQQVTRTDGYEQDDYNFL